ncbi:MAG: hypothetical protein J6A04_07785 [Clostridia bacterium]|nr:hypothetical protein [Clostridia bacterium]
MSTTNVENNPGPASIIIVSGEKNLEVACSMIMGEEDVLKNPLNITDAGIHTCEFDESKKIARRKYDGKVEKANFDIMKQELDTREKQGRNVEVISEEELAKKGSYIADDGTIIRTQQVGMDR